MGAPEIVRRGQRMGRLRSVPSTGTPGPTGPLQIVALPPCPICGMPEGVHHPRMGAGEVAARACPEPLPVAVHGPEDWIPSEGTLLKLLKRHYGWLQPEAHQLVRPRR